jgi:glycosyltransferase involved in cell wall biosynthesis
MNAAYVALMDADGQHSPADIRLLYHTITTQKLDMVLGSRFLGHRNKVPPLRIIFNKVANLVTWALSGLYVTDSQSGMKIFSRQALNTIRIQSNGFEFCSEIIRQIGWHHLSFVEVPITVRYSADSMRKGQNLSTGITTFFKLIIRSLMR